MSDTDLHDKVYAELAYHQDVDPGNDLAAFGLHDLTDRVIALVRDGELEAIVRDLAAAMDDPVIDLDPEVMGDYVCLACPDHDNDSPGVVHVREDFVHAESCAWRRLTAWVSAHPVSGTEGS